MTDVSSARDCESRPRSRRLLRRLLLILAVAVVTPLVIAGYRYRQQMAFIESVEARRGAVRTENWGAVWLRDFVGPQRLRGVEWMRGITIVNPEDADLRVMYRRQPPEILDLYDPRFSAAAAKEFHRLNGIRILTFSHLEDRTTEILAQLKSLQSLKRLSIHGSDLTANDLELLSRITSLEKLDLSGSTFPSSDLPHLRSLTNLHILDLTKTGLTDDDAAAIGQLTQFDGFLNLTGNPISDRGFAHLESLTNLQELTLAETKMTDRGLAHLVSLTNLQKLTLAETKITDRGLVSLGKMTNLEYVDLYDTDITDAGVPRLYHLTKLRRLNLTGTAVTPEGYQKAKAALPACDVSHSVLLQKMLSPK